MIEPGSVLHEGDQFILSPRSAVGNARCASITYADLYKDIRLGDRILIDDGLISLQVTSIEGEDIFTRVEHGGELKSQKGLNIPGARISLPPLTDRDLDDLRFGVGQEVDFVAASFIRTAQDVLEIRKVLESLGDPMRIIARLKIAKDIKTWEHPISR